MPTIAPFRALRYDLKHVGSLSNVVCPPYDVIDPDLQDRLLLTRACRANLSQIFGLFPDEDNAAQDLLEKATASLTPAEATDHLGVLHRMWTVTDAGVISRLTELMDPKAMFIADGHHR